VTGFRTGGPVEFRARVDVDLDRHAAAAARRRDEARPIEQTPSPTQVSRAAEVAPATTVHDIMAADPRRPSRWDRTDGRTAIVTLEAALEAAGLHGQLESAEAVVGSC
jgi:hypothetical protein